MTECCKLRQLRDPTLEVTRHTTNEKVKISP